MHVILCVTNDISTDRRVCRTACSLRTLFDRVTVAGRYLPRTIPLPVLPFRTKRMRLLFRKSFLFYAEYNLRLLLYLLFTDADVLVANDLDTLPAVFIASRLKGIKLVYDSHEYFTELPELTDRPLVRKIWKAIEVFFLPRVTHSYTVNSSIAGLYKDIYGIHMEVIRNLPPRKKDSLNKRILHKNDSERIILYQGSLNEGRGLELALKAVSLMKDVRFYIIGSGDVEKQLMTLAAKLNISDRVVFTGRIPPAELSGYTGAADIGISLERCAGLNYFYSLPNKLFDYIQAEVPVVVSEMPEMAAVVEKYHAGLVTGTNDPAELASIITDFLNDSAGIAAVRSALRVAAEELCWEKEEPKLLDIYREVIGDDIR
jgi:glycosyltransferase involved in cell wall biosynthesis